MTEEEPKFGYTVKEAAAARPIRRPVEMRCDHCGCTDIELEASVYWDKANQKWVINEVDANGSGCYCPDCGDGCMAWDEYNI